MNLEQKVFFAVAKAVRKEQETRKESNEFMDEFYKGKDDKYNVRKDIRKNKSTSSLIHIEIADIHWCIAAFNDGTGIKTAQLFAILYKLQEKELVKIHKGFSGIKRGRTTKVSLDVKGIEYIKSLKKVKEKK